MFIPDNLSIKEQIIQYLLANQEQILIDVEKARKQKNYYLANEHPIFREDLEEQYEARIRQLLAMEVANNTNLPIENVIIEIEKMDMDGYLNV